MNKYLNKRIMANPLPLIVITIWLLVTIAISKANATEVEIGLGYNQLKVGWLNNSEFKPQMLTVEGTAWFNENIGLRGQYGHSEKAFNEYNTQYGAIEYQIQDMSTVQILYKYKMPVEVDLELGIGYASYNGCYFNATGYKNYCSNDSGAMYSVGLQWKSFRVGYTNYYKKDKGIKGEETLTGISLTYMYKF